MTLDFTLEQLGVLDKALQQIPYYLAAPLINSINEQIKKQESVVHDIDDLTIIDNR